MRKRSSLRRFSVFALVALVTTLLLSACDQSSDTVPSIFDTHGSNAAKEVTSAWLVIILASVIFVLVTGALLFAVFRFRARPGDPLPRQIGGNDTLERLWTVIPAVVLFGILILTITTIQQLGAKPYTQTMDVYAVGHQWWWEFQYKDPNGGQTVYTADELHIPTGTTIRAHLVSDNVIHGFWVPQLTGKMDVIPGHDNVLQFAATDAGLFRGECTEYCSTQHAHMDFYVVTQSPSDYQAWLSGQQQAALTPANGSLEAQGQQLFLHQGCVACHNIQGAAPVAPKIGPNLTHFGGRGYIAGAVLTNTPSNLTTWILHAQVVKNGSDMPSFDGSPGSQGNLTSDQVNALVAYLESLK